MHLRLIQNRKIFFIFSGLLVALSIASLLIFGLKLGIDFTGGSLMEITYEGDQIPISQEIRDSLKSKGFTISSVQSMAEGSFLIRLEPLDEKKHQEVLGILREVINREGNTTKLVENRFESIGPVIGEELKEKALLAISLAIIGILLFIALSFRKVSKPVQSWKYGLGAIIALVHDLLIVLGVFVILGKLKGIEVDMPFVAALLTVLGYSVNDTIVVYDRTRENLIYSPEETFEETVNKSVNNTLARSINTSLTTLLVLFALYFLGGTTIKNFVLALIVGITIGTYSSIFVASPFLVVWYNLRRKKY